MLPNTVVIANQKGGVGKTTLTANLGGLCAEAGWRVLLVDLDPQGNLARHLGVLNESDEGHNLFDAVTSSNVALEPMPGVRPRLDLVAGGGRWQFALYELHKLGAGLGLEAALTPVAKNYDLILIDTPPTAGPVHDVAGQLAHYILVTTAFDAASLDGLYGTFSNALHLRDRPGGNPYLEVLGVVIFAVPTQGTAWRRRVQEQLTDTLGEAIPVFSTIIRDIPITAAALQEKGLLVTEGESVALSQAAEVFKRLRQQLNVPQPDEARLAPKSVGGLTQDFVELTKEFQDRFRERQAVYSELLRTSS